jgi:hypothetical protein
MSSQNPIKLRNGLSRLSILALLGLVVFASVVLVANPFAVHRSAAGIIPTASGSTSGPASTVSTVQTTQGDGVGLGSLLTGAPPSSQTGDHHHHGDDGNSTTDN